MKRRSIQGGPNPNEVRRMAKERRTMINDLVKGVEQRKSTQTVAENKLQCAIRSLIEGN